MPLSKPEPELSLPCTTGSPDDGLRGAARTQQRAMHDHMPERVEVSLGETPGWPQEIETSPESPAGIVVLGCTVDLGSGCIDFQRAA